MTSREYGVPVRGGSLHVAEWGPSDGPALVAIHGITASHMEWPLVADALPDVRLIAPDLRGRGASSELPGPWGMSQHAADVIAVLDHLGLSSAPLMGHSMGGFVSVVIAHQYPSRISGLLLVDGGLTLPLPAGATLETALALLGPAAERLKMAFPSLDAYRSFWGAHPAFTEGLSPALDDYIAYDLVPTEGGFRSRTNPDAMRENAVDGFGAADLVAGVSTIPAGTTLLTAPRGLQNEAPGLYSPEALAVWQRDLPGLRIVEVPDVNHYTIHILEYSRGGPTDLSNGILLCKHHHRLVHNAGWRILRDGPHYSFIPPAVTDPTRTPIPALSRSQTHTRLMAMATAARELQNA